MNMPDTIEIHRLRVSTHIGVPALERAKPQTVFITIRIFPSQGLDGLHDNIRSTIDYAAVASEVEALAIAKPRHLIETLATDCAEHLLSSHPMASVTVTVEKHILSNADSVQVTIHRSR